MLLPRDQALRFIEGYKSVLLRVLSNFGIERTQSIVSDLATARTKTIDDSQIIEKAIADLAKQGQPVEEDIVQAIRSMKVSQWVYLRHTKSAAIFIDKDVKNAYAVKALTTPIYEVAGEPPAMFITGVFQYLGNFVCDGIVKEPVVLGPGYKAQFNLAYSEIRKAGRYHAKTAA
jgi:hypothetical protein